ncbi:MAG: cell division protein FtsX [Flavobacteriales bacterium AspAUS03]
MAGVLGTFLINACTISRHIKEKLLVEFFFKNDASQEQINAFIETIRPSIFVKKFRYINKNQAIKMDKKELNTQEESLIEHQIFLASIRMNIRSDYVDPDKVDRFIKKMTTLAIVDKVKYPRALLQEIHFNIKKWNTWIIEFIILFLFILITLINNTIELIIYFKRFIIKSIQLVEVKRNFIYTPFLRRSLWWSILRGIIALIPLALLSYYLLKIIDFQYKQDYYALWGSLFYGSSSQQATLICPYEGFEVGQQANYTTHEKKQTYIHTRSKFCLSKKELPADVGRSSLYHFRFFIDGWT